jgi:mannose-6-phosphate isomerase-like protein (cupin superfamily)
MVRGSCDCFPFRLAEAPRPPCVLVRGRAEPEPNEIHPGLPAAQWKDLPVITNVIESIQLKADDLGPTGKQSFPVLRGASPDLASMSCHSSILAPGASPHPPHAHDDEEVLVVVSGRASLEVESAAVRGRFERVTAGRGDFAHYPRGFHHTIHNDGSEPLVYLMFKWRADETGERSPLGHARVRGLAAIEEAERSPEVRHPRILMEGPTACLRKLHAHWTRMPPGEGYAEHTHAHAYDAGLILLDGAVETLGQRVEAPALVYYASGQPHGLRNPDDVPARYLVFEFHGRHGEVWRPKRPPSRWQVWRRRLARRLRR